MEIVFSNEIDAKYDFLEECYESLAKVTEEVLSIKSLYEVDVSLVDDETIHSINRDYRGVDRITDVISFAFNDGVEEKDAIKPQPGMPIMLGEILICLPQALRQAKEIGNTENRELFFLFIHGLLHLLGYDHMKKEDEEIMFPLQEKILQKASQNGSLRTD